MPLDLKVIPVTPEQLARRETKEIPALMEPLDRLEDLARMVILVHRELLAKREILELLVILELQDKLVRLVSRKITACVAPLMPRQF